MPSYFLRSLESPNFWRYFVLLMLGCYMAILVINSISSVLAPFIVGFIGAYLLRGMVNCLSNKWVPRSVAAALVILMVLVTLTLLGVILVPYFRGELYLILQRFPLLIENIYLTLPRYLESLNSLKIGEFNLGQFNIELNKAVSMLIKSALQFVLSMLGSGLVLANIITFIILTPLITFYFLKDWPTLIDNFNKMLIRFNLDFIRKIFLNIDLTLSSYLRGQAIVCGILMVLYSIGLSVVGLKQALFIGIFTGFLAFIPYLGMLTGLTLSLIAGYEQFQDIYLLLVTVGLYLTIHLMEGNVLTPLLIGEKIGLHPLWILFALLVGGLWFGFLGILFAIPTAAVVGVLVRTLISNCLSTYSDNLS